jgi:hypothetical protein
MQWANYGWAVLTLNRVDGFQPFRRVVFVGVRYSYWGELFGTLCRSAYQHTDFVVYGAKTGVLTRPADIEKSLVPSAFAIESEAQRSAVDVEHVRGVSTLLTRSSLKALMQNEADPELLLHGGVHVSVPTIVGETYVQRAAIETFAKSMQLPLLSMDDEVSYGAKEAVAAAASSKRPKYFQCIHRTTDYVRASHHSTVLTMDDLCRENAKHRATLIAATSHIIYNGLTNDLSNHIHFGLFSIF